MLGTHEFWATLPVSDMARAKAFYVDRLGFSVLDEDEQMGVLLGSGPSRITLYPTTAGGADHTLGTWIVADLDAEVADLRGRGVTFEEYDLPGLKTEAGIAEMPGLGRSAWFRDSEGNILAVTQPLRPIPG